MSSIDLKRTCNELIEAAFSLDSYKLFYQPVDVQAFPTYLKAIKHPMDLMTIKNKLKEDKYFTFDEVMSDIRLISTNAQKFNDARSEIYSYSIKFEKGMNYKYKEMKMAIRNLRSDQEEKELLQKKKSKAIAREKKKIDQIISTLENKKKRKADSERSRQKAIPKIIVVPASCCDQYPLQKQHEQRRREEEEEEQRIEQMQQQRRRRRGRPPRRESSSTGPSHATTTSTSSSSLASSRSMLTRVYNLPAPLPSTHPSLTLSHSSSATALSSLAMGSNGSQGLTSFQSQPGTVQFSVSTSSTRPKKYIKSGLYKYLSTRDSAHTKRCLKNNKVIPFSILKKTGMEALKVAATAILGEGIVWRVREKNGEVYEFVSGTTVGAPDKVHPPSAIKEPGSSFHSSREGYRHS
ncbi:hypothetical protein ADUPG1_009726, partial [Aduncisulcus paluster]